MNDTVRQDASPAIGKVMAELGRALASMHAGSVAAGMDDLFICLQKAREASPPNEWRTMVETIRQHPAVALLHECAIPHHAFSRPRGYPGDAVLIDHLYGTGDAPEARDASGLLGQIYNYLFESPASRAVRYRRAHLAELIDLAQSSNDNAMAISLAAGHLREIELTGRGRMQAKRGSILAVDSDPRSLSLVDREYAPFGVSTLNANVKDIVTRRVRLPHADLIYAAGLFDYLATPFAKALAKAMFECLNPGGRLLLANFAPDIRDSGFMEAVMDWWLIYRDESGIRDLIERTGNAEIDTVRVFRDPDHQIVFLEATKM